MRHGGAILKVVDRALFKIIGLMFGLGGAALLWNNNGPEKLFSNPYGIAFFALTIGIGFFSLYSSARAVFSLLK